MTNTQKTNFWKVFDFCQAFGHSVIDNMDKNASLNSGPGNEYLKQNPKLAKLRYDLIKEEVSELTEAVENNDIIEVIDALCDILYVVYGAGISFGINIDTYFRNYIKGRVVQSGKIFKAINFDTTNYNILTSFTTLDMGTTQELFNKKKDFIQNSLIILNNKLTSFQEAIDINEYKKMIIPLIELTYTTYLIGIMVNIDLDKGFDIVHRSNMSKLCSTEEEAVKTVDNYINNDKRYDSPAYRKGEHGDYYVVYNKSTNKILKSINYTPTNFEEML